MAAVTDVTVNL